MRELVRNKGRLEDIVEYSSNVLKIIDGIEFEEFSSNILVYFATMKNVEIVGEAAYMLTKEFKASHPEIPWKQVEGMRHVLMHGYSQVCASYSLGNSKREYSRNQGSSGEIPERDRLGTLLWGMMNLFFYTDLY